MRAGPRKGFTWNRASIIYAIDLWHRRYLKTPTVAEWESAGPDHPCRQTVQRVFGSWSAAMRAAGFRPRGRGVPREPWQRKRCDQTGRWLSADQ
jgi:Homing endonuclease associated repeat